MTERERIEAAIRAGCDCVTPYAPCSFPKCRCETVSNLIAAIRAYLAADVTQKAAAAHVKKIGTVAHLRWLGANKRLAEFDAAAAEIRK